jgi:Spy/CpxP family protein refolding chaperone
MKPRNVRRFVVALPVALLAMQAALAQQMQRPGLPPGRAAPAIERMAEELNLDATQRAEVQRILEEQRARHETERKALAATGQRPSREEMQQIRQQHDEELRLALSGILTSDQLAKFTAMQAERREHMRHGPPPGAPPQ